MILICQVKLILPKFYKFKLNEFSETRSSAMSLALLLTLCPFLASFRPAILSSRLLYPAPINVAACPQDNYWASWRIRSNRPDRSRRSSVWRSCRTRYRSRRYSSWRNDRMPIGRSHRNYLAVSLSRRIAYNNDHMITCYVHYLCE